MREQAKADEGQGVSKIIILRGKYEQRTQQGKRNHADGSRVSPRLDKTLQHHLAPSFVEIDGELVAVHGGDRAGAEFRVKHPRALGEGRARARNRDEFPVDLPRTAPGLTFLKISPHALPCLFASPLRALPAR